MQLELAVCCCCRCCRRAQALAAITLVHKSGALTPAKGANAAVLAIRDALCAAAAARALQQQQAPEPGIQSAAGYKLRGFPAGAALHAGAGAPARGSWPGSRSAPAS
jgi:hypothetical protein